MQNSKSKGKTDRVPSSSVSHTTVCAPVLARIVELVVFTLILDAKPTWTVARATLDSEYVALFALNVTLTYGSTNALCPVILIDPTNT